MLACSNVKLLSADVWFLEGLQSELGSMGDAAGCPETREREREECLPDVLRSRHHAITGDIGRISPCRGKIENPVVWDWKLRKTLQFN